MLAICSLAFGGDFFTLISGGAYCSGREHDGGAGDS